MRIACINVYNDATILERCIKSVRRGCSDSKVIVVDGAYADFPHENPSSTDGTVQLALALADQVIETTVAWPDEVTKRNAYLKGDNADTYFVIDADEELLGLLPHLNDDDGDILIKRDDDLSTPYPLYRYHRHRPGIRYYGTHHAMVVGNKLLNHWPHELMEGCSLFHHSEERKQDKRPFVKWRGKMLTRFEAKALYYQKMVAREREFRAIHVL